jgi:inosose dehydratase
MNDDEWELLANGLNKLGEYALNKGIKLVYHHHMGTVVQTNYETDKLLKMTNEKYVFLLFDSGHYALSGANPANELKKHIKRVKHIHLKDVRTNKISDVKNKNMSFLDAVKFGIFTVPSDGNIDFQSIFNIIKDNNYNDWLLVEAEQDPAIANPFEMAKKAYKYIKKEFNNG